MLAPSYLAGWGVCVVSQFTTISYFTWECFPHTALMNCVLLGWYHQSFGIWYHHVMAVIWLHPFPVTSASNDKYSSTMLHCCICGSVSFCALIYLQNFCYSVNVYPDVKCLLQSSSWYFFGCLHHAGPVARCLHHAVILLYWQMFTPLCCSLFALESTLYDYLSCCSASVCRCLLCLH